MEDAIIVPGKAASWPLSCAAAVLGCAASGCGSKSKFQFDRMDLLPAEEELSEFPLGEYKIPIPVADDRNQADSPRRNRFQFDFHLYALVSPKEESQIEDAWERHEGVDSRPGDQHLPQCDARRTAGAGIGDAQGAAHRRAGRAIGRKTAAATLDHRRRQPGTVMSRLFVKLLRFLPVTTLVAVALFAFGAGRVCVASSERARVVTTRTAANMPNAEELEVSASGIQWHPARRIQDPFRLSGRSPKKHGSFRALRGGQGRKISRDAAARRRTSSRSFATWSLPRLASRRSPCLKNPTWQLFAAGS